MKTVTSTTPHTARRRGIWTRLTWGRRADGFSLLAMALSLVTAALILYPLAYVTYSVFIGGDASIPELVSNILGSGIGAVVWNTVWVIGCSILIATLIGSFFAWLVERTDIGLTGLSRFLPMMPLFVPPIAGAIGWVLLASPRSGFLNRWAQDGLGLAGIDLGGPLLNIYSGPGLVFVFVIYLIPNIFMTVSSHLRNLDPALEEAARMSGASVMKTLYLVTLPSVRPAATAGMLLALIMGLALFSLPVVIGGPAQIEVLAVRIVNLMINSYPPQTAVALLLAVLVIVVISVASWLQVRVLRRGNFATIAGRGIGAARVSLGLYRGPARVLFIAYLVASSLLPFLALLIVSLQPFWTPVINVTNFSLQHYESVFIQSRYSKAAIFNSIWLGVVGATVGILLSAVIAFFTNRQSGILVSLIDSVTKLPGAVSNLVIGIAFVVAFSGSPFYLYGTTLILLLAYIVLYIPQASLSANAALHQVGKQLTEASLMAGASQGMTFLRVTLPLMLPGLIAGWTLLFVLMSGDITASAMLAGNRNPVVGFVVLDLWAGGSFPQLAALGTVMTILSSSVVLLTLRLSHQRHRG
ncbi:ABC transporter permease [Alterinioella nitratireducens]|uniref:ABC transporter permease n=1 Tax=Alterinioella nitratireducens TaxID=2735915 RepID=UPI00155170CD|nr:iron ABC transporter permease [Alterinioella nitratireducens]NPD21476.1 iron ABC transporter permease [Alterinioella nitratireducens]